MKFTPVFVYDLTYHIYTFPSRNKLVKNDEISERSTPVAVIL